MKPFGTWFAEVIGGQASGSTGAASGSGYVGEVEAAIGQFERLINDVGERYGGLGDHQLKGFVAEAHHAGSFNIDAARLGRDDVHATMPGSTSRGSPDIQVTADGGTHDFQLKYYKTPADTATAISDPVYEHQGKVVPSDQLAGVKAEAAERAARLQGHRPEQARQLDDTAARATDRVGHDGVASHPLGEKEALAVGREARSGDYKAGEHGVAPSSVIQATDVAREAMVGAGYAAAISAAIHVAPKLYTLLRGLATQGEIEPGALKELGAAALKGGAHGAIRGGVAAALVTVTRSGMLGPALQSVSPAIIGAGTAVAFQVVMDSIRLGRGEITPEQFAQATARNVTAGAGGCAGAAVGQALIPVPVLGAVIGCFIGSTVGAYGFEFIKNKAGKEAWEAQVDLADAIARLAETTTVAVEKTRTLIVVSDQTAVELASSVANWRRTREEAGESLSRSSVANKDVADRAAQLKDRLKRLR